MTVRLKPDPTYDCYRSRTLGSVRTRTAAPRTSAPPHRHHAFTNVVTFLRVRSLSEHSRSVLERPSMFGIP